MTNKLRAHSCSSLWIAFVCAWFLGSPTRTTAQSLKTQLAQIDARAIETDRFIKRNPTSMRIFADVSGVEDEAERWTEFRNEKALEKARTGENMNQTVYVWTRRGKVASANFNFTSPSDDWIHFVNYYFRDDGSLLKIRARLNTFYGDLSVIRIRYFNDKGELLKSAEKYLDLYTQKSRKPDSDFLDKPLTVYRNVLALPFHKLL